MSKRNLNIIFSWFILILSIQFTFGFISLGAQYELHNPINIRDDVTNINLIDTPERYTDQVLILFVDGLRYDKMLEANTPNIDRLRTNGTTFSNFKSVIPSYSLVNYAAFSTGSSTNFTGVYANAHKKELEMDTLYSLIDSSDLNKSIISGSNAWLRYIGKDADTKIKVLEGGSHTLEEGDKIIEAVNAELAVNFSKIQFIGFKDVDAAGHDFGAASETYIETIEKIDEHIGTIIDLYHQKNQLDNTTIVLFSDHGHADIGGHGDETNNQTHATLILSGKAIKNWNSISTDKIGINSVTPTLLNLLGLPLAPTMNGQIIYNSINITTKSKAIYKLQEAEIMAQQLNETIDKINLFSRNVKTTYRNYHADLQIEIAQSKAEYLLNNYSSVESLTNEIYSKARFYLRTIVNRYEYTTRFLRFFMIALISLILMIGLFFLSRRANLQYSYSAIFQKENLITAVISSIITIAIVISIIAIFGFNFQATSFNSAGQVVPPILTAFFLGVFLIVFLPWLIIWLIKRKKSSAKLKFKDLKETFKQTTIGSIFFLSLPIFSYILYIIANYGPWPAATLPPLEDSYAFMIIGVFGGLLYLIPIIMISIAFFRKRKIRNSQ